MFIHLIQTFTRDNEVILFADQFKFVSGNIFLLRNFRFKSLLLVIDLLELDFEGLLDSFQEAEFGDIGAI